MRGDRMARWIVAMAATTALTGCPPDFDRFQLSPPEGTDAGPRPDGAPPLTDGGTTEMTGGPCALPYLLVAVEGLDGARPRILRWELAADGSGPSRRCGDLRAGGELIQQPFTVAWLDEGHVAAAGWDEIQVIDPMTDRLIWSDRREGECAVDVTRIHLLGGDALAVGWQMPGGTDIREIRFHGYDAPATVAPDLLSGSGPTPFGLGVYSLTQSPIHPDRLLLMKPIDYAAAEYDVAAQMRVMPSYAPTRKGLVLRSIYALDDGLQNRVVWTGHDGTPTEGVFYVSEGTGMAPQPPSMPRMCEGHTCEFHHAVPDPTLNTQLYGICDEPTFEEASLVRFRTTGGTCEVITDAPALQQGGRARMSRLAIALRESAARGSLRFGQSTPTLRRRWP